MHDTSIFLVLAGLALVFKWLTRQGSSDAEQPPRPSPPNEPVQRAAPLTEEERVRRFLEALGVPPGTQPPPAVRPRTITPRPKAAAPPPPKVRRSWAQPLPPVVAVPPEIAELPPLTTTPPPPPVFVARETQPAPEPFVSPPLPVELAAPATSRVASARTFSTTSLRPLLRSREKIRQAIILREILGPPLGLEPFGHFQGR